MSGKGGDISYRQDRDQEPVVVWVRAGVEGGQGAAPTKYQELGIMKSQAQSIQQQVEQIVARIEELEG